jgi:hypothetical protein
MRRRLRGRWYSILLLIPRLIVITAVLGSFLILLYDFGFRSTISTWFNKPGWEWKLPVAFVIGLAVNLVVTVERLRSGRLREAAMKDLEHSQALLLLVGAEALEVLLPLGFRFSRHSHARTSTTGS